MKNKLLTTATEITLLIISILMFIYVTILQSEIIQQGRRDDPFRCSDAREYFEKLEIEVDCQRIDFEVNHHR